LYVLHIEDSMEPRYKQVILIRADIGMGKGKIAAQTAHAAVEAMGKTLESNPEWVQEWRESGQMKVVVKINSARELGEWKKKLEKHFPVALIRDAGHTQVKPGTITALGVGPALESELDKYTDDLKLL
jgi:peptidyl-tRNA hydrolase, PTH2 family